MKLGDAIAIMGLPHLGLLSTFYSAVIIHVLIFVFTTVLVEHTNV